jgi:hypothetical protein
MDATERDRLFARVVERATTRPRSSKPITRATFADVVAHAKKARLTSRSMTPEAWSGIVEGAKQRRRPKQT